MKILQNQIYCVIPFYFTTPFAGEMPQPWVKDTPAFDTDAMYPFMHAGSSANSIYRLDLDANPDLRKFFSQTSLLMPDGQLAVNLPADKKNWLTPRLVVSASGEVGLLSIPMTVGGGREVEADTVRDFVNRIQKYDSHQVPVFAYRTKGDITTAQDRRDASLGLCHKGQPHTWTIATLSELLLRPVRDAICMFKPYRAHVLTDILADSPADPSYTIGDDEARLLLRLMHCQNGRYHVDLDKMADGTVMRTFENIYIGVAVEGACMMRILRHDDSDSFLLGYGKGTFQTRFLWMYIGALIQRHTLLNIDRVMAHEAGRLTTPDSSTADSFRRSVAGVCSMRLSGAFSSISAYSHINAQYRFFMRTLGVTALYSELDDKLKAVNTWLKLNDSAEREHFEYVMQTGGVILAILALVYGIPQAITAMHDTWRDSLWSWTGISLLPAIIGMVWLILIMKRPRQ